MWRLNVTRHHHLEQEQKMNNLPSFCSVLFGNHNFFILCCILIRIFLMNVHIHAFKTRTMPSDAIEI